MYSFLTIVFVIFAKTLLDKIVLIVNISSTLLSYDVELIIGHTVKYNNTEIFLLCVIFQPRLRCLAHIVRRLDRTEQFIQAIIPEVSECTKQAILTFLMCLLPSSLTE